MSTGAIPRGTDTKERVLRAAERIFGHQGYAGTTLRAVTAEAGVNLASANYHFGSKEALVMEMLRQRVAPINEERLRLLEESKQNANGAAIPLEEILEAYTGDSIFGCNSRRLIQESPFWGQFRKIHTGDILLGGIPGSIYPERRNFGGNNLWRE